MTTAKIVSNTLKSTARPCLLLYLVFLFFFILPASASAIERLAYYSDYFSFIGGDANGFVAFALDNNRGIDGSDYQAEHFGVLYDENSGWVKLVGTGDYENVHGELERIPNSPHFTFWSEKGTLGRGEIFIYEAKEKAMHGAPKDL
jgi:hypothetical protein